MLRYHSPAWWRRLFDDSEIVKVIECAELEDGPAMWEDKLAYDLEKSGWKEEVIESLRWKIDQILHGRAHTPRVHDRRGGLPGGGLCMTLNATPSGHPSSFWSIPGASWIGSFHYGRSKPLASTFPRSLAMEKRVHALGVALLPWSDRAVHALLRTLTVWSSAPG